MFNNFSAEDKELINTSNKIQKGLFSIFNGKKIDQETLEDLEALLISTDLNTNIVADVISFIKNNKFAKDTTVDDIKNIIFEKLLNILKPIEQCDKNAIFNHKPAVLLFAGVNGSGKTTIIGKIANELKKENKKVLLAGCDTFRAGAVEQLNEWATRTNSDIIKPEKDFADPAALAFKAYNKAKDENYDVLLIDTAGRLQNNINLMNELSKIERVLKKIDNNIPHQTILVLDATIGQNSFKQFEVFEKAIKVDSIIMNKLDGTSKGGVLISIIEKFKKPIFALGVGEKIDDIKNFDNIEFLKNLLSIK